MVAELTDYQFKLVRIEGDFIWHDHPETDEAFIVLEGELEPRGVANTGHAGGERTAPNDVWV